MASAAVGRNPRRCAPRPRVALDTGICVVQLAQEGLLRIARGAIAQTEDARVD